MLIYLQEIKKTCNKTYLASSRVVFQYTNCDLILVKTIRTKSGHLSLYDIVKKC